MSSREPSTLRFAVGSPESIQSWVWRMWVHRDDVYLGARNALTSFKVSLHQSDIWRIAFVNELERGDEETDRVIFKWERPEEFTPGWTPSIGILISSIEAKRPLEKVKVEDPRIHWFSPSAEGRKLVFKVLFSKPGYSQNDLQRVTIPGDRLVGRLPKRNGEIVWLVLREDGLTPLEIAKIRDVMQKTRIHLRPGSLEDSILDARALLVVADHSPTISNQPTILDIALGKENLDIPVSKIAAGDG